MIKNLGEEKWSKIWSKIDGKFYKKNIDFLRSNNRLVTQKV